MMLGAPPPAGPIQNIQTPQARETNMKTIPKNKLAKMTSKERDKLYRKMYRFLETRARGGLTFGMDFRTVGMHYPQITRTMKSILMMD